jgi:hypothetical protein
MGMLLVSVTGTKQANKSGMDISRQETKAKWEKEAMLQYAL